MFVCVCVCMCACVCVCVCLCVCLYMYLHVCVSFYTSVLGLSKSFSIWKSFLLNILYLLFKKPWHWILKYILNGFYVDVSFTKYLPISLSYFLKSIPTPNHPLVCQYYTCQRHIPLSENQAKHSDFHRHDKYPWRRDVFVRNHTYWIRRISHNSLYVFIPLRNLLWLKRDSVSYSSKSDVKIDRRHFSLFHLPRLSILHYLIQCTINQSLFKSDFNFLICLPADFIGRFFTFLLLNKNIRRERKYSLHISWITVVRFLRTSTNLNFVW